MIKSTNGGNFNFADQILKIQKEMNPKPFDLSNITGLYDTYQKGQKDIYEAQKNQYNLWKQSQNADIDEIKRQQQQAELDKKNLELEAYRIKLDKLRNGGTDGTGSNASKGSGSSMPRGRSGGMQPQSNSLRMPSQTAIQSSIRPNVNSGTLESRPLDTTLITSATPGASSYPVNNSLSNRMAVPVAQPGAGLPVSTGTIPARMGQGQVLDGNSRSLSYANQMAQFRGNQSDSKNSIENMLYTTSWQPSHTTQEQLGTTNPMMMDIMMNAGRAVQTPSPVAYSAPAQTYLAQQGNRNIYQAALMNGYNAGSVNNATDSLRTGMQPGATSLYAQTGTAIPYANNTGNTNSSSVFSRGESLLNDNSSSIKGGYSDLRGLGLNPGESYSGTHLGSGFGNKDSFKLASMDTSNLLRNFL